MNVVEGFLIKGMKSVRVKELQSRLAELGYSTKPDGVFGSNTKIAVLNFQTKVGLVADGIVGANTLKQLELARASVKEDNEELETLFDTLALDLGVEVAVLKAVMEVESANDGFNSDGTPTILFERHWMARLLKKLNFDVATYNKWCPGIVNSNPGGYSKQSNEKKRLAIARSIDDSSALQSASWGAFQIMGFHWESLGYSSVQDFVADMEAGTPEQFLIFAKFIKADDRLLTSMKQKDFAGFAKVYNGPKYFVLRYDRKLQTAYEKYSA